MYFNSYGFVLAFLPITLLGYYLINQTKKYQMGQLWLIAASLVFIGYLNIYYIFTTLVGVIIGYVFIHLLTQGSLSAKRKKIYLVLGIVVHVGILLYLKYANFFLQNLNIVLKLEIPFIEIILPIGLSFYTFQQIAYLVDCYRDASARCNFREYLLFITYFPKFVQGPIILHEEMLPALRDVSNKRFSHEHFSKGLYVFALGLGKKVLLADTIALFADAGFSNIADLNAPSAWFTMVAYSLQLYFDFSGYCDMAIGVGEMLQIPVPINFNSPYKATSVPDIWGRWHMTLTRFFTKYIYIPLGGSRSGNLRMYANTFIVFLVSGLWHGAAWTYVVWGAIQGIFMVISKLLRKMNKDFPIGISWFFTYLFWVLSLTIFRASSLAEVKEMYSRMLFGGMGRLYEGFYSLIEKKIEITLLQRIDVIGILGQYPEIIVLALVLLPLVGCLFMKNSTEKMQTFSFSYPKLYVTIFLIFYSLISLGGVTVFLYAVY